MKYWDRACITADTSTEIILYVMLYVDKVHLILVPCNGSERCRSWRMQGVPAVVRGELCRGLSIGGKVTVIGVPTHRLTTQSHQTFVDVTIEVSRRI
jgi:hypothetical protein